MVGIALGVAADASHTVISPEWHLELKMALSVGGVVIGGAVWIVRWMAKVNYWMETIGKDMKQADENRHCMMSMIRDLPCQRSKPCPDVPPDRHPHRRD